MKKITIYLIFSALVVAFAVLNIAITNNDSSGIDLKLDNLEAVAGLGSPAEWGGLANLSQGQGLWKDEWIIKEDCPTEYINITVCIDYTPWGGCIRFVTRRVPAPTRQDIRCSGGNVNCTPISC